MYIPFSLFEFVIDKDFSPKDALQQLSTEIEKQKLETECEPLLHFLKVASTATATTPTAGSVSKTATVVNTIGSRPAEVWAVHEGRAEVLLDVHLPSREFQK